MPLASSDAVVNAINARPYLAAPRAYEDHYLPIIENATPSHDWPSLLPPLKKAFSTYPTLVSWRSQGASTRLPSTSQNGNLLEAINITLNVLQYHYMDRDLSRTGNSIVVISPGSAVFEVDKDLAGITRQRMMDCGVGSDVVALSLPPLHVTPFFVYRRRAGEGWDEREKGEEGRAR